MICLCIYKLYLEPKSRESRNINSMYQQEIFISFNKNSAIRIRINIRRLHVGLYFSALPILITAPLFLFRSLISVNIERLVQVIRKTRLAP